MVVASDSLERLDDSNELGPPSLTNDVVIWLGDLNYRINGVIGAVTQAIQKNMYEVLWDNDQFQIERKIGRVGENFEEGKVCFAPTYKIVKGYDNYSANNRIPSWTDRIIFQSKNKILKQMSYDSNNLLKISDHRPVFS